MRKENEFSFLHTDDKCIFYDLKICKEKEIALSYDDNHFNACI